MIAYPEPTVTGYRDLSTRTPPSRSPGVAPEGIGIKVQSLQMRQDFPPSIGSDHLKERLIDGIFDAPRSQDGPGASQELLVQVERYLTRRH